MTDSVQADQLSEMERRSALEAAIARLPRVHLAALPTPLEECPRLSMALGGPRILVKRDDLTGLAFGGNKTRQLEFVLGKACAQGTDVVLASSAVQSNLCRQVAAAASKLGLRAILLLRGKEPLVRQGNLLLDYLLGAEVRFIDTNDLMAADAAMVELAAELEREGHRPFIVNRGWPLGPEGVAAYANCALELASQMRAQGVNPDYVYLVCGSTTQAGLTLGLKWLDVQVKVVGINLEPRKPPHELIVPLAREGAELLGLDVGLVPEEVNGVDDYIGPGYGVLTEEVKEAIHLFARTEGILVDPAYTGKALLGLIGDIRRRRVKAGQTVVFLHTGGTPGLFNYAEQLM